MNDLISRQMAIDVAMQDVSDKRPHDFNAGATRAANRIKLLPTVEAIPIEWILLYIQEYPYMTASSMLHYWSLDQALERKEREKGYYQTMYGSDILNTQFTDKDAHFGELVLRVIRDVDLPMLITKGEKDAVKKALIKALDDWSEREE